MPTSWLKIEKYDRKKTTRTDMFIHGVRHDYTIGTVDVLKACDACVDMGQL